MTDNLPAIREDRAPVAQTDVDSWTSVVAEVSRLATFIADTEFVPKGLRGSAPATAAAILYGREVGLPPMTSLNVTHVIEGKPGIEAEAMRAMVYAAGHEIEFVESTGAQCVIRGRRHGQENWTTLAWSVDMARAAGLLGKSNWKSYPRQMLQARCSAELCRMIFPDVIHGFRTVEELDDLDAEPDSAAPAGPTTKVSRPRKTAAKKSAPPPLEERGERPALSGPPLPGEDGYETSAGEAAPGERGPSSPRVGTGSERAGDGAPDSSPADAQATDTGPGGTVEEESGADHGGADDETPAGEGEGEAPEPAGDSEEAPKPKRARLLNRAQQRGIEAALTALGVDNDRDERHLIAATILGRPVDTMRTITFDEASTLMDTFARLESKEQLTALLDEFDARATAEADRWNEGDRS